MIERTKKRPRASDLLLIGLFALAISIPLAINVLGPTNRVSHRENRLLAKRPPLPNTPASVQRYPEQFEDFYSDRFGAREFLLRSHALINFNLLGEMPTDRVMRGKDGWFFNVNHDRYIDDIEGRYKFVESDLTAWSDRLLSERDWLAARGIRFLIVLIPNKHTIYPEFLADGIAPNAAESRRSQLVARLSTATDVDLIDLTTPILEAKARGEFLYPKTDTHWNGRGAYAGYRAIQEKLKQWFPALNPFTEERLEWFVEPLASGDPFHPNGDITRMMSMEAEFLEPWHGYRVPAPQHRIVTGDLPPFREGMHFVMHPYATETNVPNAPRAVYFGDSYRWGLVPLLSEDFSRILYVDARHTFFNHDLIEQENPDVVIFAMVGRFYTNHDRPRFDYGW